MKKSFWIISVLLVLAAFFIGRATVNNAAAIPDSTESATLQETQSTEIAASAEEPKKGNSEYLSHEAYSKIFNNLDYGDKITYVIGHMSPDSDTVTSAIAMANLLNELGIKAEARIAGSIDKETAYILDAVGMEIPEILENAEDCQLWLVDHSQYSQAVAGADKARIVGIVDHHGIGDAANSEQIIVRSGGYGSTSAEIYVLYKECGISVSKEMARVMLTGLVSDTTNLKFENNMYNREIYDELVQLSEFKDIDTFANEMFAAKLDYSDMTAKELLYSDYKNYEKDGVKYGIGNIKIATVEELEPMAEALTAAAEEEIKYSELQFIFFGLYDSGYQEEYIGCVGKNPEEAKSLLELAFGEMGEIQGDYAILRPSVSRKKVIVPAIDNAINSSSSVLDAAA